MDNNLTINADGVLRGIKLATSAIRPTYGPFGINAGIRCDESPYIKVVNDAKTIVDAIQTHDRNEELGLLLYKEMMDKQDAISGDGRKTTAIIADELITLGSKLDMPKVKLKQELDALIPVIEAKIDQQKRVITEDDISAVASVASESEEIGALLGDIYKQIGKDGIIHLEPSGTPNTTYKVTEGVRFMDASYLAPTMANDDKRAVYENPTILVTKKKISNLGEINPLLSTMVNTGRKNLVIFTDDMDSGVAASLVRTHLNPEIDLKILIIKAPTLWKQYVFEDFAKCVGATIVEDATGLNLKTLPLSALGTCGKIITDAQETILLQTKDISEHIEELKKDNSFESKMRLSWLATKTCNLYLGANGENDLYYKTMKCKDAINASRLALQDGVVQGGGMCLFNISKMLASTEVESLLQKALEAPYLQLAKNSGRIEKIYNFKYSIFQMYTQYEIEEINHYRVDESVLDASMVIKNAVRSAIGLASTALTIGLELPFLEKTQEELAMINATKKII